MLPAATRAGVHIPTVLAIGLASFAAVTVVHKAGGHGVACLLVGGEVLAASSTELRCDGAEDTARLVVTAGGKRHPGTRRWPSCALRRLDGRHYVRVSPAAQEHPPGDRSVRPDQGVLRGGDDHI